VVAVPTVEHRAGGSGDLFAFRDVVVERGGRQVLHLPQAAISSGGSTAIVGPSGSGKSTLLRLCNRLEAPTAGTVRYLGEDLTTLDPTALRRKVAMVFQQPVALEGTVADNLRQADPDLPDDAVEAALVRVGLPGDLGDRPAQELSGGERQRLGLARSLSTDPDVVLLDEVTSALDPANAARIERLVAGLVADGITAIWVTHDVDQLRRIADHVIVVVDGEVVQSGAVEQVLAAPIPPVKAFLEGDLS
jgi:putative ABC transport system ATP-binding protein